MLTRITAFLLIFSTFSATCTQMFVYAGFELNRKYIAEQLCVNKSVPQLNCKGKCYLMTKLKQAQQKEKARELENQRVFLYPAMLVEKQSLIMPVFHITSLPVSEKNFILPVHTAKVFQPPRA